MLISINHHPGGFFNVLHFKFSATWLGSCEPEDSLVALNRFLQSHQKRYVSSLWTPKSKICGFRCCHKQRATSYARSTRSWDHLAITNPHSSCRHAFRYWKKSKGRMCVPARPAHDILSTSDGEKAPWAKDACNLFNFNVYKRLEIENHQSKNFGVACCLSTNSLLIHGIVNHASGLI